ncbi:MAG TPA: hypothetical protein VM487_14265 [Phycisphaerae bacterium]|nr:hypothetical protein [Phycisphaerae bacterium]
MEQLTDAAQFVIPFAGLLVGWLLKHKTPLPNATVPAAVMACGAVAGLVWPGVDVGTAVALAAGSTAIHGVAKTTRKR